MRSKKPAPLTVALPLLLTLAACGGGTTATGDDADTSEPSGDASATAHELDSVDHEELVERATEEGEVTVYSFTSRIAQVEQAFEEQYPAIDLIGHDISSTEQITRLQAEAQAGTPSADVAYRLLRIRSTTSGQVARVVANRHRRAPVSARRRHRHRAVGFCGVGGMRNDGPRERCAGPACR